MLISTEQALAIINEWYFTQWHVPKFGEDSEKIEYTW